MADRDWSKELAKVDKQLASLPDDALLPPTVAELPPTTRGEKGTPAASAAAAPARVRPETSGWGVYSRLVLSVALGVAMVLWPYEARCGVGLGAYLAAVVVVITSGVWSSIWTWRHRASRAHALSLLLILWGLLLGSIEVLPRVGYAKPDARHPAQWACVESPPPLSPPRRGGTAGDARK
jgi:hypothetical protein